jgi:SAM-dependent methyltransferase
VQKVSDRSRAVGLRLNAAVLRLGRLLPASVAAWLQRLHRPLSAYMAARPYRRQYHGRFVSTIHAEDDLMHFSAPLAEQYPVFRHYRAAQMYFRGGDYNADDVERVLVDAGFPLRQAASVLEFASGHGRLTRHFVPRLHPGTITVCDIEHRAVDFLTERLGVRGFYSTTEPEDLSHEACYDMVVVVSLFSHLPHESWGRWLRRLCELLKPGGVLLITTHQYNDANPKDFEAPAEGFLYRRQNETRGRLDVGVYGAAFVTTEYVEHAVAEHFDGHLVSFAPHGLLMAQDAYVLQRTPLSS